jgi:hypothetical protein
MNPLEKLEAARELGTMLNVDPAAYVAAAPEEPRTAPGSLLSRAKLNADRMPRAYTPYNWMPDADAFECCCAACSSHDE